MLELLWDASGLAKRYALEVGSDTAIALYDAALSGSQVSTSMGYAEVYSILVRKKNGKVISQQSFNLAVSLLRTELIEGTNFKLLSVPDTAIYAAWD